jgi:hypothetical protein
MSAVTGKSYLEGRYDSRQVLFFGGQGGDRLGPEGDSKGIALGFAGQALTRSA